jgi:hypothetical protein
MKSHLQLKSKTSAWASARDLSYRWRSKTSASPARYVNRTSIAKPYPFTHRSVSVSTGQVRLFVDFTRKLAIEATLTW